MMEPPAKLLMTEVGGKVGLGNVGVGDDGLLKVEMKIELEGVRVRVVLEVDEGVVALVVNMAEGDDEGKVGVLVATVGNSKGLFGFSTLKAPVAWTAEASISTPTRLLVASIMTKNSAISAGLLPQTLTLLAPRTMAMRSFWKISHSPATKSKFESQ